MCSTKLSKDARAADDAPYKPAPEGEDTEGEDTEGEDTEGEDAEPPPPSLLPLSPLATPLEPPRQGHNDSYGSPRGHGQGQAHPPFRGGVA